MMNKDQLVNILAKDTKQLEKRIEYRKLYNIRNAVIRALIKSGIAIDYALPFILVAILIAHSRTTKGNSPFIRDYITEKAGIETIDTSNGSHIEHLSFDFNYSDKTLEHSTGWIINDKGLYQRTVTTYRLDDSIDLSNTSKVLSMSKEEIENSLVVTNIQTIQKNTLTDDDYIYDEDAIIIINHSESEEYTTTRLETRGETVLNSLGFMLLSLIWGINVKNVERLFVKTYMRDKLREYEPKYKRINKEELSQMRKILELKKQNLEMIMPTGNENNGYAYRLRKV